VLVQTVVEVVWMNNMKHWVKTQKGVGSIEVRDVPVPEAGGGRGEDQKSRCECAARTFT